MLSHGNSGDDLGLLRRRRSVAPTTLAPRRADVARLGPLQFPARAARARRQVIRNPAASSRPRCSAARRRHRRRLSMFARPRWCSRLVEQPAPAAATGDGLGRIVYGGGPMYLADLERGASPRFGHRFAQIYGQGESPMTITALSQAPSSPTRPSALARAPRLGRRRRSPCVEVASPTTMAATLPPGEVGEIWCAARRSWRATGAIAEATAPRPCATAGSGPAISAPRRRRLPHAQGPLART